MAEPTKIKPLTGYSKTLRPPLGEGYWQTDDGLRFWRVKYTYDSPKHPANPKRNWAGWKSFGYDTEDPEIFFRFYFGHKERDFREYGYTYVLFCKGAGYAFRDWYLKPEGFEGEQYPLYRKAPFAKEGKNYVEEIAETAVKFTKEEVQGRPEGVNEILATRFASQAEFEKLWALFHVFLRAGSIYARTIEPEINANNPPQNWVSTFPLLPLAENTLIKAGPRILERIESGDLFADRAG